MPPKILSPNRIFLELLGEGEELDIKLIINTVLQVMLRRMMKFFLRMSEPISIESLLSHPLPMPTQLDPFSVLIWQKWW
jgi:hypothetical protein